MFAIAETLIFELRCMLVRGREEEFFFDPEGFNEEHHVTSHNDRWFGINFLIR